MALETFTVFSMSGLVLWEKHFDDTHGILRGDPVSHLISDVLLQERGGMGGHLEVEYHQLQYAVSAAFGLVFLAVYNKGLSLPWIAQLVKDSKKVFTKKFNLEYVNHYDGSKIEFDTEFTLLLKTAVANGRRGGGGGGGGGGVNKSGGSPTKSRTNPNGMRSFKDTKKGKKLLGENQSSGKKKKKKKRKKKKSTEEDEEVDEEVDEEDEEDEEDDEDDEDGSDEAGVSAEVDTKSNGGLQTQFQGMSVRQKRSGPRGFAGGKKKKNGDGGSGGGGGSGSGSTSHWKDPTSKKLSKKESKALMASLNASSGAGGGGNEMTAQEHDRQLEEFRRKYLGDDDDGWSESKTERKNKEEGGWFSSLSAVKAMRSMAERVTGNATITEEELSEVKKTMIGQLVKKNVARDVADVIMNSVTESVVGQKLTTFEKVSTVVNTALESSVGRILTPKQDLDLVRNIHEVKKKNKPYVIVFVGINGVGKSTSLAKVCYHLLQKSFRPLIAACDTFRSGAVEQLKVHADCLGVDVFEQGYASDSSKVAQSAITHATREGHDVVLVDTAGRMQNNKPHMVALSAVVTLNNPDLILFVGEALAGNDAIDQMTQFNQSLRDHAKTNKPRLIDGIVLTKFDCVDDKVGTAVSMVHKTRTPIMFVGTGQKYTHLRKLNVEDVLQKLFAE